MILTNNQEKPARFKQDQDEPDSNTELIDIQHKLSEKEKKNEHLSQFEMYLKDKIDLQIDRKKKEKESLETDPHGYAKRKLAMSTIEQKQDIYEYVQREIEMCKEGIKSPKSLTQQFNGIYQDQSNAQKFMKINPEYFYSQQRTRPSTSCNKMHPEIVNGQILNEKDEKQLKKYRQQFNMHHFYNDWLNEKKIRLNSQIDAYVNSISKLNQIEQQQESLILKDKFFLSSDKRKHIERISSASTAQKHSHHNYISLHSNPTSITPNQLNAPSMITYKQYKTQTINQNSNKEQEANKKSIKIRPHTSQMAKTASSFNQNQSKSPSKPKQDDTIKIDTLKTNKSRPFTAATATTTPKQDIIQGQKLKRQQSTKTKTPDKKTAPINNIFEAKNDLTLFNNFVYSSPFPKWIVQNSKYEELKQSEQYDMNKKIISICKMESFNRTGFQKHIVALFLSKISLFKMMPFHMLEVIAQRLTYLFIDQDQYICKLGDKGDCMYIIFQGQVQIIINGFIVPKIFCGGEFVGRTALETDKPRNADMRAKKPCHLLVLSRLDYQQCLNRAIASEKGNITNFILSHSFFRHFRADKVERLCEEIKARFLAPKECLYKESDPIDNFYIIKQGSLIKTMSVDMQQQNKWPNKGYDGSIYWENYTSQKKVTYTIQFGPNDIVGYFDMITSNEKGVRTETVDSISDTFMLYINKNIFNTIFDEDDLVVFREFHRKKYPSNQEGLKEKIKQEEDYFKANLKALESGVRLQLQSCEQTYLDRNNDKINKLIEHQREKKEEELQKKIPHKYQKPETKKFENQSCLVEKKMIDQEIPFKYSKLEPEKKRKKYLQYLHPKKY